MILIGKRPDEITVKCRYYAGMFNEAERFEAFSPDADWQRLQDTLDGGGF